MFKSITHIRRLLAIVKALARHDALFPLQAFEAHSSILGVIRRLAAAIIRPNKGLDARPGKRLAAALQTLGPAFIKLGQTLATRPDLIGAEIAEDLTTLQDRLPPFSAAEARTAIEAELGAPVDELFSEFDDKAVAAASIAQVHLAVTADGGEEGGREVAVKILRPGIEQAFARDVETFFWLARQVERALPRTRRLRPREVVQTLADSVRLEMDLRMEAAAASELAENMQDEEGYRVPKVDWTRTAQRVLTIERIHGVGIGNRAGLEDAGHDCNELAVRMVRVFLTQAIRDGYFHADLHQGNFFVEADGTLVPVDFGIMGRLDRRSRRYLAAILWGFHQRDFSRVADIHFEAGYVPSSQSRKLFAQALRAIAEPILDKPLAEISFGQLMAQLLATTEAFSMQTQPQLLVLQRTMVMAEGLAMSLMPDVNMWETSRPVLEKCVRDNFSPTMQVSDGMAALVRLLTRLPEALEKLEKYLDEDQFEDETATAQKSDKPIVPWVIAGTSLGLLLGYLLAAA